MDQVATKFRIAGKLNEGVAFKDLEERVKQAAENSPTQVIHAGPWPKASNPFSLLRLG